MDANVFQNKDFGSETSESDICLEPTKPTLNNDRFAFTIFFLTFYAMLVNIAHLNILLT